MSGEVCDGAGDAGNGCQNPTVLVVDDDPLTQCVLKHYLGRAGYRMIGASNGREALRVARTALPKLIILDVMMPGADGWTVLRRLKKLDLTKEIPVVLLSGNKDLMAKEESLQSGATQLLVKPISPDQLLKVIRRLIPSAQAAAAVQWDGSALGAALSKKETV